MAIFGNPSVTGASGNTIEGTVRTGQFWCHQRAECKSITARVLNQVTARNAKCAIYTHDDIFVAVTEEIEIAVNASAYQQKFNFTTFPKLKPGLYQLAVWADAAPLGTCSLMRNSATDGVSKSDSAAYGTFPDPLVPSSGTLQQEIFCAYEPLDGGVPNWIFDGPNKHPGDGTDSSTSSSSRGSGSAGGSFSSGSATSNSSN